MDRASSALDFDAAERVNLTIAGGAIATAAALTSPLFTASLALGAVLEVVNYRVLRRATEAFFRGQLAGGGAWAGGFGVRYGLLAVVVTIAVAAGAHPVGLIIGLSTMVPAVVIAALRTTPPICESSVPVPPPDDPSWDDWSPWLARERSPEPRDEEGDDW